MTAQGLVRRAGHDLVEQDLPQQTLVEGNVVTLPLIEAGWLQRSEVVVAKVLHDSGIEEAGQIQVAVAVEATQQVCPRAAFGPGTGSSQPSRSECSSST